MKLKSLLAMSTLALLPLSASAATLIVPASGSGPGANGSHWQTDMIFHNSSTNTFAFSLVFHDQTGARGNSNNTIAGRTTGSLIDVVGDKFHLPAATGAIEVTVLDDALSTFAVRSRTINVSANGEFGQDIPAINVNDAMTPGDIGVLLAPRSAADYRLNIGIYAVTDTTIHWQLFRGDGSIEATKDETYTGGTQHQYNNGISTLFGAVAKNSDAVQATVTTGKAIVYGSAINQISGDPSYVPAQLVREETRNHLLGVDTNEDGTIDILDANHDGVLDSPVEVFTIGFPTYFRISGEGENYEKLTYQILSSTSDAVFIDDNGTIEIGGTGDLKGMTGSLKIKGTGNDNQSSIFTIPLVYR